ncbi:hypothetical protein [Streptomyces sp. NPDC087437]|uniref:hypothetical protein n=1 Tax=Streptomyces sp. NPDC087437 TaxID=3365789 RepID=UPI00380892C0
MSRDVIASEGSGDGHVSGRRGRWLLVAAGAVGAVVGAGAVGLAWALSGSGADAHGPEAFTMSGSVVLPVRGSIEAGESSCTGYEGSAYRKVAEGAAVVVFGPDGARLGEGKLGVGRPHDEGNQSITCTFPVSIPGVKAAEGSYQIRVADLSLAKVAAADARSGFTVTFQ